MHYYLSKAMLVAKLFPLYRSKFVMRTNLLTKDIMVFDPTPDFFKGIVGFNTIDILLFVL